MDSRSFRIVEDEDKRRDRGCRFWQDVQKCHRPFGRGKDSGDTVVPDPHLVSIVLSGTSAILSAGEGMVHFSIRP